jgi:predicted DNA-binding transcriptional regulator AlpA
MDEKLIFRTPEAAKRLGLGQSTLEKWRMTGEGPAFVRLGKIVGYEQRALDAWLKARTRQSTSEK